MALTIGQDVAGALYTVRMTHQDFTGEQTRKITRLVNTGGAGEDLHAALQAYESMTDAGLVVLKGSLDAEFAGQNTTPAQGQWSTMAHQLVLGFQRAHPLDNTKTLTTAFIIPGPAEAIVDTDQTPKYTRGISFTAAANPVEALGALIDWLEDALVCEFFGVVYEGGWTFVDSRSGLISVSRIVDGVPTN